ncbi:MAG: DNA gyrase/topoisomerase IV subunit A [Bacillota bacterium]
MTDEIIPISIEEKMKESYLNYSLSVIVGRALPDVRDGLKPVHRRLLYGAYELGLTSDKPHKKSARIIGEVLGKFHPHGDNALYNAMVRMAQDFNQRYPLIDGHGNYGSIDGDSAAAMRYTEARLSSLSQELLKDLKFETVDYKDNFDNTLKEPKVLPAAFPQLLVNGSSGIAVGMSTDIPPHNLGEVIDAAIALINNKDLDIEELIEYIPGPDFPTGGQIIGENNIKEAYQSGNSSLKVRGKINKEYNNLIITEIPYQINKTKLISEITDQIEKENLRNITDIRDESDQHGIRIVLNIKSGSDFNIIKNRLFKYTSLMTNIRVNMLALLENKPIIMNLKDILIHFIKFRRRTVKTRIQNLLERDNKKLKIMEGIIIALDFLDKVIYIIRGSKSKSEAIDRLSNELDITKRQANAIMEMQLQRLVRIQQQELKNDHAEIKKQIENYKEILNNTQKLDNVIINELEEIKATHGDQRRTQIIKDENKATIEKEDLIKEKEYIVSISAHGLIKKSLDRENIRTAKGDFIIDLFNLKSFDDLLFFTKDGQVYRLPIHDIPEHHGLSTGDPIKNYFSLPPDESLIKILPLNEKTKEENIIIVTARGKIKATKGDEYISNVSKIKAINLEAKDSVKEVFTGTLNNDILIGINTGRFIRFNGNEISATGRNTKGYNAIKFEENQKIIFADLIKDQTELLMFGEDNRIAKVGLEAIKSQKRYGKGNQIMHKKYDILKAIICLENSQIYVQDNEENSDILETQSLSRFTKLPVNRTEEWPINLNGKISQIDRIMKF